LERRIEFIALAERKGLVVTARYAELRFDGKDARTVEDPGVDGVAQVVGDTGRVSEVAHRREAGI
jgi:hypothetical protein